MKLIVVAALVAFAAAKLFSDDLSDSLTNPAELPPFKAGQQYRYRFDSQVASGIAGISHQKSLTRIQAEANVYFESDRSVVLRLDKIQVGAVNARMIQEPSRMHPFSLVEQKQIEAHQLSKLQLPLQFNYIDGLIDRISFHSDDDTWSKNIKRSVLNLLQVNLKGKNLPEEQEKEIKAQDPKWQELTPRAFTAPETTIEGECDTTYVISKLENLPRTDVDFFNVTKTINFQRCQKLSDVHYGPRVESQLNNNWQEQSLGQEVDRSTIIRHFVVGTPEKFSIKRVESVSQYTFNTFNAEQEAPMLSVVVNELTCIGATKDSSKRLTGPSDSQDETLLYSNAFDRDVKRFYMYGDEEYQQETPFSRIQNKQKLIFDVLRQIQKTTEDKKVGVEAEATVLLPRLVELVRTCTVQELKEIVERVDKKAEEILIDALAIAATRNTIHVMAEKIMQRKLSVPKAIQTLKALREVPAPSDKQVDILIRLCKSDRVKESESLRQTCWLTVGTLMGEFCETSKQNSYVINEQTESEMCPKHFTDKFIETLFEEYQEADTRYERILILKSYGNAGLKESVRKLKKIIYDQKEDPLVRAQAIDSLRRLRNKIPNELQQILLPVFKNQQELTEVRLHALSLVLQTVPNKAVIDQIASVLIRDKSKNVKSFVYDVVKSYAMSPLAEEQNIAQNLQAVLKLAGIDEKEEEKLRSSRAQHIPIYSNQQDEGVFLNLESIFASDNAFPKKLSAGLDSFLNGVFEKNTLEINIQQEDVERWYEKTVNQWFSESQSRGRSSSSRSESELGNIFSKLIGKSRRDALAQSQGRKYQSPFGFLSLRLRDIDVAVLPLEEEVMPKALQQIIINAKKPTLRDFDQPLSLLNGETFRLNTAWNFYERMTKIPTTAGIPLKLTLSVPALLSVEGSGRLRKSGVAIKVQPSIAVSHVKKIEAWSPLVNSGVENVVSVESNIPIDGELMVEGSEKKTVKVTMNLPEFENRLLGFHSLPVTYIREYDQETGVHKEPRVKTIQNELLVERDWHLDHLVGQETLGLPLHFNGHIHIPAQYSYLAIVNALSMAENHVHVEFKPTQDSPRQVQLTLEGETFHRIQSKLRPQFRSFYDKFDAEMEERYEFRDNNQAKDEQRLDRIAQDYQTRDVYRHGFEARLQTIGGRQEKSGKVQLESTCDAKFGYCKTEIKMERDSLFEGERRDWKLESTVQTILPEYSADFEQYQEKKDQKSQKFICAIDCRWGTDAQQYINIRVNGEQAKTQAWIDEEETQVKKFNSPELREKSAFLNKYDISAEYELSPAVKSLFSRGLDLFKLVNFWNTKTELVQEKKVNGLVTALVVIDPISRQHMNVSIKTPTEKIRVNSITTNVKVSPFPLIRRPTQPLNSAKQLLTSIIAKDDNTPQECSIDGSQVRTFDDVVFKAPITKCYTVLAKDCNRDSRFAVLMKKINGENKKLKMIDRKNIIEVESAQGDDQFQIRVNDEHIPESQWDNYGITKLDNLVSIETHDITVRFNGRQAWIQISRLYKNDQCGICGHYDDDAENEFVQGNNEKTSDLRQYYRSFTMKDSECDEDFEESIRKHKFETVEENEFGRWDDDSDSYENGGEEPIEKTQVVEYNHKICFSKKPVPECPRNLYPTQSKKDLKVQYGCLTRDSIQARRLIRQLKTDPEGVAREAHQLALSFTETLKVPTRCVEF